jgi:site-specific DNA recombinase
MSRPSFRSWLSVSSYKAQVDYYTRHIQENDIWEFIDVYTDAGVSAANTKKRDGFVQSGAP